MNAELITIGDEILIGQILDSNAAFMGQQLTAIGIDVVQIKTIRDDEAEIIKALNDVTTDIDVVLITGGLGPTKDDVTKHCFCRFFEDELVENKTVLQNIKTMFARLDTPVLPANLSQAMVPSKARVLHNAFGTAPGMWMERQGTIFVAMPGVPYEMKNIVKEEVIPRLIKRFDRPFILQKTLLTYGVGESRIAKRIEDWENDLPSNMSLAYLPQPGKVRLRVMIRGHEKSLIEQALSERLKGLEALLKDSFVGYEGQHNLQEDIADKLKAGKLTIATAESCTGGKIAAVFTEIPGASTYFKGGLVPYQTQIKSSVLNVPADLIDKYSVVSAEVAQAMAKQAQNLFQSDIAIATTGNAGPTKGDSDADVGTVFIAIAYKSRVFCKEFHLGKSRDKVVERAINEALMMLAQVLPKS